MGSVSEAQVVLADGLTQYCYGADAGEGEDYQYGQLGGPRNVDTHGHR
jgi:hypothetical protein